MYFAFLKRKELRTMDCATTKEGYECFFMRKDGCRFNGGSCHAVVEQCDGCQRVESFPVGKFCLSFPDPNAKWRNGDCNMATHVRAKGAKKNGKLNPLKASKRASQ
jgi:hypothetical protein